MKDEALQPALYVVSTPIGNLEDITLRALRVLREVSLIACEDTRQTKKLLDHYDIPTRTLSYHEHNELERSAELIVKLEAQESVALVSDAGTPGINDPGYRLIALALRHNIRVVPVPGASAFVAALVASGLGTDEFRFGGFLPARKGQRRSELERLAAAGQTQIFYEAPHRLVETLEDIAEVLGPKRRIVIAREVTKFHEEFLRGSAAELFEMLRHREGGIKGEVTLLIARADAAAPAAATKKTDAAQRLRQIMESEKLDEKSALKALAKEMGVAKSEAYREVQRKKDAQRKKRK